MPDGINNLKKRLSLNYNTRRWSVNLILITLPILLFFVSFLIGRYPLTPVEVILTILAKVYPALQVSPTATTIVWDIRLPRIVAAILVGAALSVAGASFQGTFKNPLVSPDILGVSSGAGFGASIAILLVGIPLITQVSAFVWGLIAVCVTYALARSIRSSEILIMVLSGMGVGSLFTALISLCKYMADPFEKLPQIVYWLMGSLASVNNHEVLLASIPIILGISFLFILRWKLNILAMGDEESKSLGVDTGKLRFIIILCCTMITAAAVSISGIIGWVGLIIPHISRMLVGPDHKNLLPATICLGASFLLLIDNISRTILITEVPIGILTAIIGAPFFLYLLRRGYNQWT
ncbi:FecCD family ABC transporter permease [Methanobacterium alcaliphilum]|uniref:FecCD family ABC transporter permease n=1 Tax=Methanobacterium alcaliphilum TaxID=392018 RepID=UPI00200B790B|nr:iron ABC transporter permease [Methanobacterium alcaliphilum]MCK9151884.1 iron ABC transporter permease [Methanobacterium alcaliphilum]